MLLHLILQWSLNRFMYHWGVSKDFLRGTLSMEETNLQFSIFLCPLPRADQLRTPFGEA